MPGRRVQRKGILAITLKFWCCNFRRALEKERVSSDDAGNEYSRSIRGNAVKKENGNTKAVLQFLRHIIQEGEQGYSGLLPRIEAGSVVSLNYEEEVSFSNFKGDFPTNRIAQQWNELPPRIITDTVCKGSKWPFTRVFQNIFLHSQARQLLNLLKYCDSTIL